MCKHVSNLTNKGSHGRQLCGQHQKRDYLAVDTVQLPHCSLLGGCICLFHSDWPVPFFYIKYFFRPPRWHDWSVNCSWARFSRQCMFVNAYAARLTNLKPKTNLKNGTSIWTTSMLYPTQINAMFFYTCINRLYYFRANRKFGHEFLHTLSSTPNAAHG